MSDQITQEIVQLEYGWMTAVQHRDIPSLERILGSEYVLITGRPGSEIRSRQEYLDITRNRYAVETFHFEHMDIHVYGDTALVRSRYRQTGHMNGERRDTTYLMTDVWIRRDDRWQVVTRHVSPL